MLLETTGARDVTLVEPADDCVPLLRARFDGVPRVRVLHGHVEDLAPSLSADTVVLVNVLEHVADVATFLAAIHRVLVERGVLLLLVPALPSLYGSLDRAFGHHRRYTRPELARALGEAGFTVERLRFLNLPGVIGWFVAGRILRQRTLRARDVRLYDRCVIPWLSRMEARLSPPFGQSLVAVARK